MGLEKYNEKRDFSKTKEPKGIKKSSDGVLRFVVQKHAASHLHYDFRLEIDGVLVSWAVPKGPSSVPSEKRLAMQTEDHPMDYIDFEGTIPQGEYGGGTVMVWDIGTYHAEGSEDIKTDKTILRKQLKEGNIKVVLNGQKMLGSWHIVRMKDERQWLMMKGKDKYARDETDFDPNSVLTGRDFDAIAKGGAVWSSKKKSKSVPETPASKTFEFKPEDLANAKKLSIYPEGWRPQKATLADEPFDNADWLFETKYDGYRATAEIDAGKVNLVSRNGISFNTQYSEIADTLKTIKANIILDGEIVVEDAEGNSHFQWLQHFDESPKKGKLSYYVFDILYFNGYDLRGLELIHRKKILKALLPAKLKNVHYSEHIIGEGIQAFLSVEKNGGEGLIAKKLDSKYHVGLRTKDWLKVKIGKQQEMIIVGFTEPQGGRKGIGALLCAYYKGDELIFSGKVGSGFNDTILKEIRKKLDKIEINKSPFTKPPRLPGVHWVKPEIVAQVKFSEFTETGSMRHPVFLGLREDKKAREVIKESPKMKTEAVNEAPKNKPEKLRVEFTHLDKVFWPKEKITKGDVINYYSEMADYILPFLVDRPESLRRTPDGINSAGFFQKNVTGTVPKWIKTKKIKSESKDEAVEYLLCQDKETLLFLANYGCIEMNPWSSRVGSLNNPDYIIFDLDPKDAPMKNIIKTALKLKEILDQLKVPAYIKTSGGNGLHVFIPVLPKYTYEQTREFSHIISQMVNKELPGITSLERLPDKRKGKVYLDFLQNGKGKTMASIYSIRPREGAGVSTPLHWEEVNDSLTLSDYNINTVPQRVKEKGDLWKGFFKDSIDIKKIISIL